jgi:hypothetical protein
MGAVCESIGGTNHFLKREQTQAAKAQSDISCMLKVCENDSEGLGHFVSSQYDWLKALPFRCHNYTCLCLYIVSKCPIYSMFLAHVMY